jgi:Fur family ferric uptake transcriptional regulator
MGSHTAAGHSPDEIAARLRAAGLSPTRRRRQVLEALGGRRRPVGAHEPYVELAAHALHYHLVCRRCGDVQEHSATDGGAWLNRVVAETGFHPDPPQAEVHGMCGACRGGDYRPDAATASVTGEGAEGRGCDGKSASSLNSGSHLDV